MMLEAGPRAEVVVPLPRMIPMMNAVRGTVLVSSRRSLQARGRRETYEAHIHPDAREALASMTAAAWYPCSLAEAHYAACEALALPTPEIRAIGAESGRFINASVLTIAARLSREIGNTPWTFFGVLPKLMARTWTGGATGVVRLGPKEARVTWVGQPLARNAYFREASEAFMHGVVTMFARTAYVKVVSMGPRADRLVYTCSWV